VNSTTAGKNPTYGISSSAKFVAVFGLAPVNGIVFTFRKKKSVSTTLHPTATTICAIGTVPFQCSAHAAATAAPRLSAELHSSTHRRAAPTSASPAPPTVTRKIHRPR
jgi:hypothetical protein